MTFSQMPSLQSCSITTYYYDCKDIDSHVGFQFGDSVLILGVDSSLETQMMWVGVSEIKPPIYKNIIKKINYTYQQ